MKNKNTPAFPIHGGDDDDPRNKIISGGLTKREYFAAMAMQAIIPSYMSKPVSLGDIDSPQRLASQWSIKFADELLKQLEDGNNKS